MSTWLCFGLLDEMLGQRQSTRPPAVIASTHEESPGPSSAVGNSKKDEEEQEGERMKDWI